jgi:hypothetical protein
MNFEFFPESEPWVGPGPWRTGGPVLSLSLQLSLRLKIIKILPLKPTYVVLIGKLTQISWESDRMRSTPFPDQSALAQTSLKFKLESHQILVHWTDLA